jgi:hypothetical protein
VAGGGKERVCCVWVGEGADDGFEGGGHGGGGVGVDY